VGAKNVIRDVELGLSPEWRRRPKWFAALSFLNLAFLRTMQILCLQRSDHSDLAIEVVVLQMTIVASTGLTREAH